MTPVRRHVLVIGAGVSGLRAASSLVEAHHRVTVLEARARTGGRLQSTLTGLDLGASWFWPGETRVASLVAELGIATHSQHLAGDAMYDDMSQAVRLDGNPIDVTSSRFVDGADSLTTALAARLKKSEHADIVLDSHVHRIVRTPEAMRVTFRQRGEDQAIDADQVVLALPPSLATTAIEFEPSLPADVQDVAEHTPVWMGAVTKVVARYATPFWREAGLSGSAVSHRGPLREIHDLSGPDGHPAALFGFASTTAASGPVTRSDVVAQLTRLFGPDSADPTELTLADWRTEEHTSPPLVERRTDYSMFGHRAYQQPCLGGRLHWCSTETSTIAAGHIEGALAAADRAVAAIVAATGLDTPATRTGSPR